MAIHETFIEHGAPRLGGVRLAQDPPHELRERPGIAPRGERAQDISERAVPSLLQGLLGHDGAHVVGRREQVLVLGLGQLVLVRGLDGDLALLQPELQQKRLRVLRVDEAGLHLVGAGSLDLNQKHRANVARRIGLQRPGLAIEILKLRIGTQDGVRGGAGSRE